MAKKKENKGFLYKLRLIRVKVKYFLSHQTVRFALGAVCLAFTIFLGFSLISFLWSGGGDQTIVESVATGEAAGNASGKGGAVVSNYLVNGCFGWASLIALPFLVLLSCTLMDLRFVQGVRKVRWGVITLFLLVWCSVL